MDPKEYFFFFCGFVDLLLPWALQLCYIRLGQSESCEVWYVMFDAQCALRLPSGKYCTFTYKTMEDCWQIFRPCLWSDATMSKYSLLLNNEQNTYIGFFFFIQIYTGTGAVLKLDGVGPVDNRPSTD